jgi:hypothetical protein
MSSRPGAEACMNLLLSSLQSSNILAPDLN